MSDMAAEAEARAALAIAQRLETEHGITGARVIVTPVNEVEGFRRVRYNISVTPFSAGTGGVGSAKTYASPDDLDELIWDAIRAASGLQKAVPLALIEFDENGAPLSIGGTEQGVIAIPPEVTNQYGELVKAPTTIDAPKPKPVRKPRPSRAKGKR